MDSGRNDGGIRRGDKKETGDLEARPNEGTGPGGSGVPGGAGDSSGRPTAETDALADGPGDSSIGVATLNGDSDLEDLTIHDASDADLGLTGIGDVPAEDWAADTGPTRTGETASHGVDRQLVDEDRAPGGRTIPLKTTKKSRKR